MSGDRPVWPALCCGIRFRIMAGARGICKVDEDNFLTDVVETKNMVAPFNNKMNNIRIDLCTDYK